MKTYLNQFTIPSWVQWVAQDRDGHWWGYEVEPLRHEHGWYENEVGRCIKLGQTRADGQWKDSLERLPAGHSRG